MDDTKKALYDTINDELAIELDTLCCHLSPENLSCDGECTRAQVNYRLKNLMTQWYAIEKTLGFEVDVDDFEMYFYKYREETLRPRL